jgi:hypothetical protein
VGNFAVAGPRCIIIIIYEEMMAGMVIEARIKHPEVPP